MLSSFHCGGRIKNVKKAEEELADSKSNRMSIKLYRIEARYFVPEVSTPRRIRAITPNFTESPRMTAWGGLPSSFLNPQQVHSSTQQKPTSPKSVS